MSGMLRAIAWAIALAAAVDPAIDSVRRLPVTVGLRVAVAPPAPEADELAARLHTALGKDAVVVTVAADSTGEWCLQVAVCIALADGTRPIPGWPATAVHLVRLPPPSGLQLVAARVAPVHLLELGDLHVGVTGGRAGESFDVVVEDGGLEVGRATHRRTTAAVDDDLAVAWWPRAAGARALEVRLEWADQDSSRGQVIADVTEAPAEVLVWDARPSWTGTFVRRALAEDARVVVRSRGVVAPGRIVGRGVTGADEDLRRAQVVVVGGADALDGAAVERLLRYARGGGAVVVALDEEPAGPARALLPGPVARRARHSAPETIGPRLRASEIVAFRDEAGDVALASLGNAGGGALGVVVERPTGRGRIVVSGALDAWRWRDDEAGFGGFWRDTIVRAARQAGPALTASWSTPPAGGPPTLSIIDRDGAGGGWAPVQVALSCPGTAPRALVAVPGDRPGHWTVEPTGAAASCVVQTRTATASTTTPWPGRASLPAVAPRMTSIEWMAVNSGGSVTDATDAVAMVAGRVSALPRRSTPAAWYPMRSWWWVVLFAVTLGAEWWRRRRRGLL